MKTSPGLFVGALFAALPLLVIFPAAQAQVLVEYAPGTAASASAMETAGSVASGMTASATLIPNNGVTFIYGGGTSPNDILDANLSGAGAQLTPDQTLTVQNGTYFAFTLTANAGQTLSLSSLTFNANVSSTGSARAFYVLGLADNGPASTLVTDNDSGGTLTTSLKAYTANLSGAQYQNLSTITFKFYIATGTISQNIGFNDIVVNGAVNAVPEPATWGLLLAGGAAAACSLRRRARWNKVPA